MTRAEHQKYRNRLLSLNQRFLGNYQRVREETLRQTGGAASGGLSNVPLHLADLGTDSAEHEVEVLVMENEGHLLEQIQRALSRLDQGEFGYCLECKRDIPAARLEALPYTPYCVECARRLEQLRGANGTGGRERGQSIV
jgi:RNA polymerase-binding transcription factor DksA